MDRQTDQQTTLRVTDTTIRGTPLTKPAYYTGKTISFSDLTH